MQELTPNCGQISRFFYLEKVSFYLLMATISTVAFSISLFKISSSILMAVMLLRFFSERKTWFFDKKYVLLCILFILANLASVTQTNYQAEAWRGVFKVFRFVFLSICVMAVVDSKEKFKTLFNCFLWSGLFVFVDAILQGTMGWEINGREMTPFEGAVKRISGPFKQSNDLAAYCAFVIFLFVAALESLKRSPLWRQGLLLSGVFLGVICLYWSYSRGAWLAVAATIFLYGVLTKKKWLLIALLGVSIWAAFFSPELVQKRFKTLAEPRGTAGERIALWKESLSMIKKAPVLGVGTNTYTKHAIETLSGVTTLPDNFRIQYVHNGYLQMAVEIGLLGLGLFLMLVLYGLFKNLRVILVTEDEFLRTAGIGVFFAAIAFLLHSFVDTNFQSTLLMNLLWLALGLLWVIKRLLASRDN